MPHEITPNDGYVATDSIVWTFDVEEDGSAKSLSGASVDYLILPDRGDADSDALLDDGDSTVTVDIEPSGTVGRIEVTIDRGSLDRAGEHLWQRLRVHDSGSGQKTFSGAFYVNPA
jgi:hypothetical protein